MPILRIARIISLNMLAILLVSVCIADTDKLTADEIITKQAAKYDVDSELEFIKIVSMDPKGSTTRYAILFLTAKQDDGSFDYLIRVISPKNYSGVGLLINSNADNEVKRYMYLPALGQVKQLKGAKGGAQSFLGSNFTYDDLIKETPGAYTYKRLSDGTIDETETFVIEARSKTEEIDQGHRKLYIGKKDFNIYKIEFYDSEDTVTKSLTAWDYNSGRVDGPTMRPLHAEMRDHEARTISILTIVRSRFNIDIDPKMFTKENLGDWDDNKRSMLLKTFVYNQTE